MANNSRANRLLEFLFTECCVAFRAEFCMRRSRSMYVNKFLLTMTFLLETLFSDFHSDNAQAVSMFVSCFCWQLSLCKSSPHSLDFWNYCWLVTIFLQLHWNLFIHLAARVYPPTIMHFRYCNELPVNWQIITASPPNKPTMEKGI